MYRALDLTTIPNELRLILDMVKEADSKSAISNQKELLNDIDWHVFIKHLKHHRLYPIVHSRVKMLDDKLVPRYVYRFLEKQYTKNTYQMLRLSAEMEHIGTKFFRHQVRTLFLKGPALAHELYGDISLRTCSDLDVIIPIEELSKAEQILNSLGYEKDDYIQSVMNDWKWRYHHVTYFHPQKRMKVEVHWRLHPGPGRESGFDALWERKRKSSLVSGPVYLPGK